MENEFWMIDATNTHNAAAITIQDKGYKLRQCPYDEDGEIYFYWWATKGSHLFKADNPLTLLGIISIWEHRGDNWSRDDDESLIIDTPEECPEGWE